MWKWIDRLALVFMAIGMLLMFQPWWVLGFKTGFFLLLVATIVQIISSHCLPGSEQA